MGCEHRDGMIDTEAHKRELAALKGIHLERIQRADQEGGFRTVDVLAWRNCDPDLSFLEEPPAPPLVRWNEKCLKLLPKLKRYEVQFCWTLYVVALLSFSVWAFGKLLKAW